jgi:uncharacterized protein
VAEARLKEGAIEATREQRIVWLDVLRGASLFGIAQINFPSFAAGQLPISALYHGTSPWIHALYGAITLLITAKFYPIFAFLFGYGHALQRTRLMRLGFDPQSILRRRYAALLLLGVVHGSLLFFGDILTMYALAGMLLLAESGRNGPGSNAALLRWSVISVIMTAVYCLSLPDFAASAHARWVGSHSDDLLLLATRDWSAIVATRASSYVTDQLQQIVIFLPQLMLFMNAGIWACERGVLQQPWLHRAMFRRCLLLGVGVGLPVNLALMVCELQTLDERAAPIALASVLDNLAFILSLAYLGWLGLYAARERSALPRVVFWLAALGRVALTNYIVQSLVMLLAWTLCWRTISAHGSLPVMAGLALLTCLLQMVWAVRQARMNRQGPLEARWRSITYGPRGASISN